MQQIEKAQIKALIGLLGQETGERAALLREALAHLMQSQPSALYEVIETDFNSEVPSSLIAAMEEICWNNLNNSISHFAEKINPNIEEALTLVTRFVNPASQAHLTEDIDELALALRPALANATDLEDICNRMARFFFRVEGFSVLESVHHIKDISFGHFLKSKQGSALCLGCLYVVCAERFGLDCSLVDLAGRILVCFTPQDSSAPVFVDPLAQGTVLTLSDCQTYIRTRQLSWEDDFVAPLSSKEILQRLLGNLIFILNKLRDVRRLTYLRRYMDLLNQ